MGEREETWQRLAVVCEASKEAPLVFFCFPLFAVPGRDAATEGEAEGRKWAMRCDAMRCERLE